MAYFVPKLDPRYLGEIELGFHSPTVPTALRIAHALGVSMGDLTEGLTVEPMTGRDCPSGPIT